MDEPQAPALSPRGRVIFTLAWEKRGIRSVSGIHNLMRRRAPEVGCDPAVAHTRATVSNYIRGETRPDEDWLTLFALALGLTDGEMQELALAHTFGRAPSPVPIA